MGSFQLQAAETLMIQASPHKIVAVSLKPEDKSDPQIILEEKDIHPQQLVQMDENTILMVYATAEEMLRIATLTQFIDRWSCCFDEGSLFKGPATLLHKIDSQTILLGDALPPCLYILKSKAGQWAVSENKIPFKRAPIALLQVNPKTLLVANSNSSSLYILNLEEGREAKWVMEKEQISFCEHKIKGHVCLLQVDVNTVFVSYGESYLTVIKQQDKKWFNSYQDILVSKIETGSLWLKDRKTVLVAGQLDEHNTIIAEVISTSKGWVRGPKSVIKYPAFSQNYYFYKQNPHYFYSPTPLNSTIIHSQVTKDFYEFYFKINSNIDLLGTAEKISCSIIFKGYSKAEKFFKFQLFTQLTHQLLSDLYIING